jgi:hypothetical protein
MNLLRADFAGVGLMLLVGATGCGMIHTHPDCDEVARQQRPGETEGDIAKAIGYSLADVQSCLETGSSGGRETAGNLKDQARNALSPQTGGSGLYVYPALNPRTAAREQTPHLTRCCCRRRGWLKILSGRS